MRFGVVCGVTLLWYRKKGRQRIISKRGGIAINATRACTRGN
jgi:hypothetical protein